MSVTENYMTADKYRLLSNIQLVMPRKPGEHMSNWILRARWSEVITRDQAYDLYHAWILRFMSIQRAIA